MSLKYKIVYVSAVDRFTGMPVPYGGPPVPAEHRVYFINEFQNALKSILFGHEFPYTELSPLKDIIEFIHSYDDLVEELVKNNLNLFWTREKHQRFLTAFKFFADHGFYMSCQ